MATAIAIPRGKITRFTLPFSYLNRFNKNSFLSLVFAGLFVLYFLVPHTGALGSLFKLNMLFVFVAPVAAFILSIVSMRQIVKTNAKGLFMSTAALVVTSLYFIVALAIPVVLLGFYVVYAYLLR